MDEEKQKKIDEAWKANANKEPVEAVKAGEDKVIPVNFPDFVMSLGVQTLIFLGEVPNPLTNKKEPDINQARFLIDTLSMLKKKTQGNLPAEEARFMDNLLYDLQMKFAEKALGFQDKKEG